MLSITGNPSLIPPEMNNILHLTGKNPLILHLLVTPIKDKSFDSKESESFLKNPREPTQNGIHLSISFYLDIETRY